MHLHHCVDLLVKIEAEYGHVLEQSRVLALVSSLESILEGQIALLSLALTYMDCSFYQNVLNLCVKHEITDLVVSWPAQPINRKVIQILEISQVLLHPESQILWVQIPLGEVKKTDGPFRVTFENLHQVLLNHLYFRLDQLICLPKVV